MTAEEFRNSVLPMKDRLFRFAFRYLHNRPDAEDAVQDVMLKLWEMDAAKKVDNIEAWCMTMTRNKSLDMLKRKGRTEAQLDPILYQVANSDDPSEQMERGEAIKKVKDLIRNLPKMQQLVIELRDFQGKTYAEIAELLNIEINLVKVNLHRARKKIREEWHKTVQYGIQQ
ncbi:MAG: RNA polymerase sigma factor [Flavobacteriales bacterium]